MICARVSLIFFILLSNLCLRASELKSFGDQQRDDSMPIAIRHRQKELSDTKCKMSLAFYTDAYGLISEFLFLGGKIILPCSCSKTFCNHSDFGYMEPFPGQTGLDRFKTLEPKWFQNTKLERDTLRVFQMVDRIVNVAIIEVTHKFLVLANNHLKNGIYCTCNGSPENAARVNLPTYRVCSEKECQKSCQNMPPGAPEICSVPFWNEVNCEIRSPNKTDNTACFGSHQCHPDLSCPSPQYLSFQDNQGMCLDSNDTYWRHGMCQAYHKNLLDNLTWEVHFHSKFPALGSIMESVGVEPYAHLSKSCEKDLGSHLRLGGRWDIRVLQTYQLTDASTSLLLFNGSACSRHTNPLKAFLCQNLNCSKRTPLPGNCDAGWKILLKDFTRFRHQIRVTNVKDINVSNLIALDTPEAQIRKIQIFFAKKVIPQDAHFARFFVIPDRILMINRNETSDGNVTTVKQVCLFPGGNTAAKGNTCMTEKEIHWMSCYPKIQKFIINQRPTLTSLISSTASNGDAPLHWWRYALIAIGSLLVASLIIIGIVIFMKMRSRKCPAKRLALFKMPQKAEMDDEQRSPIVLKELKNSVEVSVETMTKSSDVAVDPTQESSEKSKNRRLKATTKGIIHK